MGSYGVYQGIPKISGILLMPSLWAKIVRWFSFQQKKHRFHEVYPDETTMLPTSGWIAIWASRQQSARAEPPESRDFHHWPLVVWSNPINCLDKLWGPFGDLLELQSFDTESFRIRCWSPNSNGWDPLWQALGAISHNHHTSIPCG